MAETPNNQQQQPKPPTLEELARAEEQAAAQRAKNKQLYQEQQKKLRTLVPERYFTMARQVRDGVGRFNGAAKLERLLNYTETTAVTVRDKSTEADFYVEVRRDP